MDLIDYSDSDSESDAEDAKPQKENTDAKPVDHSIKDEKQDIKSSDNLVHSKPDQPIVKRRKISENSEKTIQKGLPDIGSLFNKFSGVPNQNCIKLACITKKNTETERMADLNSLIKRKEIERLQHDIEQEEVKLKEFRERNIVEEVIKSGNFTLSIKPSN